MSRKAPPRAASLQKQVRKAANYYGSVQSQSRAIQNLARKGRDPRTGRKVGVRRARKVAAHIGDYANE